MKCCRICKQNKDLFEFVKSKAFKSGFDTICLECSRQKVKNWRKAGKRHSAKESKLYYDRYPEKRRYTSALRRASKMRATPAWANLGKIKEIYQNCPEGFHVDHIIPLQNNLVCGLHVENNLQIIPAKLNLQKGNDFNGTGKHAIHRE